MSGNRQASCCILISRNSGALTSPVTCVAGDRAQNARRAGWQALHVAIDDHSRVGFSLMLDDGTANSAYAFLCLSSGHRNQELHPWMHHQHCHRPTRSCMSSGRSRSKASKRWTPFASTAKSDSHDAIQSWASAEIPCGATESPTTRLNLRVERRAGCLSPSSHAARRRLVTVQTPYLRDTASALAIVWVLACIS